MKIGNINLKSDIMIVAEIGNNHEGDINLAKKMIKEASLAGADAVKFQTIEPEKLISIKETKRIKQLKKFQFTNNDYEDLYFTAKKNNIMFLSTPFSVEAVDFLDPYVPAFKVASGDNDYTMLLKKIAEKNKPILLSTGMSDLNQIKSSIKIVENQWKKLNKTKPYLILLHCVSSYPTPLEFSNIMAIKVLSKLGYCVGYSDHTLGIESAILSVALGVKVIEKHFTMSKNFSDFRDHKLSLEPKEFRIFVDKIREAKKIMGKNKKEILDVELDTLKNAKRSICASKNLQKGKILTLNDLICLRPSGGIKPGQEVLIIGKRLKTTKEFGDQIYLDDLGK